MNVDSPPPLEVVPPPANLPVYGPEGPPAPPQGPLLNAQQEERDLQIAQFLQEHPASSGDSGIYSPNSEPQR